MRGIHGNGFRGVNMEERVVELESNAMRWTQHMQRLYWELKTEERLKGGTNDCRWLVGDPTRILVGIEMPGW